MLELTNEQKRISRKNRTIARKHFNIEGNSELLLHHKDTNLRHNDIERYIQWNIDDLEVIERGAHTKLHYEDIFTKENKKKMSNQGKKFSGHKHSEVSKEKIRNAMKGRKVSEEAKEKISIANKGRKRTEESRKKMSEHHYDCSGSNNPNYGKDGASKGKHWYNNGVKELYDFTCPEGFVKGRLKRG